jgi:ribose transport system permease protein
MSEFPKRKFSIQLNTQTLVFIVLMVLWVFLSITSPHFFNINNIRNLFSQEAIIGVLAVGQLYTIITAGIDLSVGTVAALVNVILTLLVINGTPIPLAILLVLGIATGVGISNGVIIYELNMPPFIVTLGTMSITAGAALLISGGTNISGLPISFANFGSGIFLGMPNLFWLLIIAVALGEIVLRFSKFGKYVYAVGSSVEAARLSGVNVRKVIYGVYTLSGFLAGVGGVMLTTRLWMGVPTAGSDYNLNSIAAAAIGGASLFGAQGTVIGAFLGAIVMSTIYNGTVLLNVNPFWQEIIVGALIIGTVALDQIKKRQKYTYTKK